MHCPKNALKMLWLSGKRGNAAALQSDSTPVEEYELGFSELQALFVIHC